MARQNALGIVLENGSTPASLVEILGGVLANFQKGAVSQVLKNKNYTQIAGGASVEVKRYENVTSKTRGTARTANAGDKMKVKPVIVAIDQHKEIVEEFAQFDIDKFGEPALLSKRAPYHASSMIREADTAFFAEAVSAGTEFTPSVGADTVIKEFEELVVKLETVKNDFVDGVDRGMLAITVSPEKYSALLVEKDFIPSTDNSLPALVGEIHNVAVLVSNRLPVTETVKTVMVGMMIGSVAQPLEVAGQYIGERIQLSTDYAISLFYDYGTDAVMPDLIFYINEDIPS